METYTETAQKWVPGDEVYYVSLAMQGGVLFGLRGGAVKLKEGAHRTFTVFNTSLGLPSRRILSVFENKNEVIWFGTRKGLCRLIPIELGN
jgi:ligand-binding sensor domain-containing protein